MSLPAWKLALLERKKKQEEEEKAKRAQDEEAKLASLPPWKRAIILREKQDGAAATTAAAPKSKFVIGNSTTRTLAPSKTSDKWQVAVERVKGADSPILKKKPRWQESPETRCQTSKTVEAPSSPGQTVSSNKTNRSSRTDSTAPATKTQMPSKDPVTQRWKQTTAGKPTVKAISVTPPTTSSPAATSGPDDDLSGMPAWKRALILKKRKQQEPPESGMKERGTDNAGSDETDSAAPAVTPFAPEPEAPKPQHPEVVNRTETAALAPQRLVEREGKTLRAPVYKEVDEWANVKEDDDKFKGLPLWKQALIKRRRADIAKRSGTETVTSTVKNTSTHETSSPTQVHSPVSTKPVQKHSNTKPHTASKSSEQKKSTGREQSSSRRKAARGPETKAVKSKPKAPVSTKNGDIKPARRAPEPPSKKKDPMFTYNFSKSTRHTLDTGASSSDSTDSELEDAIVTNLDESSDEGDSGIVLQHYKYSTSSSPNMGKKSHSDTSVTAVTPAVSEPGKKKGVRHLRRVSWSDTNLVSEHFYPKYDYSDYDDIEQERKSGPSSNENSGLSHRLHPSLRPNNESDPYAYGFSSAHSTRSPPPDNSLSTFVPKALSSYSPPAVSSYPQETSTNEDMTIEEVAGEEETDDFYTELASNTAALLW